MRFVVYAFLHPFPIIVSFLSALGTTVFVVIAVVVVVVSDVCIGAVDYSNVIQSNGGHCELWMPLVPCLLCSPAGNSDADSGNGEVAAECTTTATTTTTTASETARIEENGKTNTTKFVFNGEQTVYEERPDEITNIQSSSNSYEQGEGIRQHLIEAHAKFVAKAFLYPDLSSSIHYWLMACVEYGTPPNDPMINQICSTATTDGDQLIATSVLADSSPPPEQCLRGSMLLLLLEPHCWRADWLAARLRAGVIDEAVRSWQGGAALDIESKQAMSCHIDRHGVRTIVYSHLRIYLLCDWSCLLGVDEFLSERRLSLCRADSGGGGAEEVQRRRHGREETTQPARRMTDVVQRRRRGRQIVAQGARPTGRARVGPTERLTTRPCRRLSIALSADGQQACLTATDDAAAGAAAAGDVAPQSGLGDDQLCVV
ncbi:unnamed protein product [Angiostrongylus costaricensis]|uniref:Uncharacterized protein n=1 Tax=Angiostrongylus costaricensis TaxID=334426 RepID=A0A158PHH9_ANGCS|nr:unnamed protein product [Angiostrongylus costaricensis]